MRARSRRQLTTVILGLARGSIPQRTRASVAIAASAIDTNPAAPWLQGKNPEDDSGGDARAFLTTPSPHVDAQHRVINGLNRSLRRDDCAQPFALKRSTRRERL